MSGAMKKPKNWILLWHCPKNGTLIYCNDKRWRKSPDFGDFGECAKQYTSSTWALKVVERRRRYQVSGDYTAVHLNSAAARNLGIGVASGEVA